MKRLVTVMDFSGAYEAQDFWKGQKAAWLDVRELQGTNCYCGPEAEERLRELMAPLGPEGIHFLDSGNYHYVTKLWTDLIKEPFELLVFDNHTDMQAPLFGDILSCGGWIRRALEENPLLKRVFLAGPPEAAAKEDGLGAFGDRVRLLSREALERDGGGALGDMLGEGGLPLYISVDKDVLCRAEACTNWDQGTLRLKELKAMLQAALKARRVIGADICGEDPEAADAGQALKANAGANRALLEIFGDCPAE